MNALVKSMPRYFCGNVLSPTDTQPEADDHTFAFTREEAAKLDLTDTPIRMEHEEDLEVGRITRHWQAADGSVWVVGRLNDDKLESKFAKYAIEKNPETGTAYYTGLSLQHTHTEFASRKKSKKEAIEVSLCVNPRRSDCRIAFVDSEPNQDETKKVVYKIQKASVKRHMASENSATTTPSVEETSAPVETPVETTAGEIPTGADATDMSKEDMMRVIIQQQKDLEESQSNKSKEFEELKALKEMLEKQKAEEKRKEQEKTIALSKALVDHWASTLDKTEMDEQSKESVLKMARDFPKESQAMLRIAHMASKKHKSVLDQFEEYKEVMKRSQLQEKFASVMSKKRAAPAPAPVAPLQAQAPVVHAASNKKAKTMPKNDVSKFLAAMSAYSSSGSARDHMDAVAQMQQSRRGSGPRPPTNRAPYY